jgi:hypothetical protein
MNSTRYIFHIIFLLLIPFLAKGTPDSSEIEKSLQRFAHFIKQNESSTKKNHYFKYQSIELDNATHMAKEYVNGGTSMLNVNDPVYSQITQELSAYNQALGGSKSVYVFHGRYFLSYEARFYKEENKSSYNQFKSAILEKLGIIESISVVPYDNIPQSKRQAFVEALESFHKENKKGELDKNKTTQDLVRRLGDLLKSQNLQAKKIIVVFLLEEYAGNMTEKEGVKGLDKIDVAINIKGNLWSQYLDLEQSFGIIPDIYGFLNSQERNADEFNITLPEAGSSQTEGYGKALLAMVKRLLRVEANLKAMQQDFFDYLKERAALEKRLKEYITANNKLNKDQKNQTYIEDKGIIASIIEKLKNLPVGNTGAIVIENAGTGRYEVVKNGGGLPEVIELTDKEKALLGKLYGKGGISLEQLVEWLDFADDTIEKQLDLSCKFCPPDKIILEQACKKMQEIIDKAGKNESVYISAVKTLCAKNDKWGEFSNFTGSGYWYLMAEVQSMEKTMLQAFLEEVEGNTTLSKNIQNLTDEDIKSWKEKYDLRYINTGTALDDYLRSSGDIVSTPIAGLYANVNLDQVLPNGFTEDSRNVSNGFESTITINNSKIVRAYDVISRTLYLSSSDVAKDDKWIVNAQPPLVQGRGTPTQMYVTLHQMKNTFQIPYSGLKSITMESIINAKTLLQLCYLKWKNPNSAFQTLILQTHSLEYANSLIIQSGHSIKNVFIPLDSQTYLMSIKDIIADVARGNSVLQESLIEGFKRLGVTSQELDSIEIPYGFKIRIILN